MGENIFVHAVFEVMKPFSRIPLFQTPMKAYTVEKMCKEISTDMLLSNDEWETGKWWETVKMLKTEKYDNFWYNKISSGRKQKMQIKYCCTKVGSS